MLCNANNGTCKAIFTDIETAWLEVVDDFRYLEDGKNLYLGERKKMDGRAVI